MVKKIILRPFLCAALICISCIAQAQTWKQLDDKTTAFYNAGKIDSAIFYGSKELTQAEKEFGKTDSNYYYSLDNLGQLYKQKGDYTKAEPLFVEALTIVKNVGRNETTDYAAYLDDLADMYVGMERYSKAEPLLVEAVAIRRKISVKNTDYAMCLNDLGSLYESMRIYSKAEPLLVEALSILKKLLPPDNPDYATALINLGTLYEGMGAYSKAEPYLVEAQAIFKKAFGQYDSRYGKSLENLGYLYEVLGNYAKAEPRLIEAQAIFKKVLGPHNPDYAISLENLAYLYKLMGEYGKAEPLFLQAIAIIKKFLGPEKPRYATSINDLALLYKDMGLYSKAEPLLAEALAIRKKVLGSRNPAYAESINNLAGLYLTMGNYTKAEPLFLEALTVLKEIFGTNNPNYALTLNNLAGLYLAMANYTKAEPLLVEAAAIRKRVLGADHVEYAQSLNNLANLYLNMGLYAKAEPLFAEALIISKQALGDTHPDYALCLNDMGILYQAMGEYAKAEPLFLQAKKVILRNINSDFDFLSEAEKEKYISSVSINFAYYQNFFRSYHRVKPSIAAEAYDIELATKGIILSSGIELNRTIQASGNKDAIDLFDHWAVLKNILATLYALPISKRRQSADSIENLANEAEKQLTRFSASFRQGKLFTGTNWKNVHQKLKTNEVAIEFSNFRYHTDKRWTDTTFYTALVLRKGDTYPAMVNLCRQDQLDSLLTKTGNTRGAFITNLYRGAAIDAVANSTATRQKLYELVWKPIEKLLHKGDHIYYAPSGLLHQVAFAAIPREDGKLLSDRYQLTQLSSTAMLLQPAPAVDTKNLSIAAYGGIKYDASDAELASRVSKDTQRYVSRSLSPDSTRGGSFEYLPSTLTEINSIASLGKQYHVPVTFYTGINATEESYKRNGVGASPRIIHIATHGFFFPDPKKANPDNTGLSGEKQQFQLAGNPLNRAGLAFAGANHAWKGEAVPPGMEDGILTAYEASNVPLSNTQLVVLSACETGLGDIKGSEGVFGLQRAFKAAGASYIMMSLWQVPDAETAEFMKYFYKDLFSGQSIEEAFLSSQTTMKNKYRNDPYKWAAFVLMR